MNEWYRTELKKQIPEIIKTWETKLGLEIDDWQIKLMKTKWGTCNIEKRKIWLNLELAKKPIYCLEYIIVHEMLHLLERHHNDTFLNYMNTYLPKWKQIKSELNKLPVSHADWNY
jgi:predicted metal-dependent hydrolase